MASISKFIFHVFEHEQKRSIQWTRTDTSIYGVSNVRVSQVLEERNKFINLIFQGSLEAFVENHYIQNKKKPKCYRNCGKTSKSNAMDAPERDSVSIIKVNGFPLNVILNFKVATEL